MLSHSRRCCNCDYQAMESRKSLHNLVKSINSLLGLKTNLTSKWVESVCNIVKQLPPAEEPSCSSEIKDYDVCSAVSKIQGGLIYFLYYLIISRNTLQILKFLFEVKVFTV